MEGWGVSELDRRDRAAVNQVFASVDRRGPVGDEEGDQLGDLFRTFGPADGDASQRIHEALARRILERARQTSADLQLVGMRFSLLLCVSSCSQKYREESARVAVRRDTGADRCRS